MQVRVCSIDETQQGDPDEPEQPEPQATLQQEIVGMWSQVKFAERLVFWWKRRHDGDKPGHYRGALSFDDIRCLLMYSAEMPSRRKRVPVDVEAMVEKWIPIIRGLATAHDRATVDQCEFIMEEHLLPLTAAPIAQLRAFYKLLCQRLKDDPTIPFFVWSAFHSWADVVLDKLPDGGMKALRTDLARKCADLIEQDIKPDLNTALVGALQWRPAEDLEKLAGAVQAGAKPRLKGRESCLFVVVDDPVTGREHTVML